MSEKLSIKELYPSIPLSVKLRGYLALTRPYTLIAPLLAGLFGGALPLLYAHINPILYWKDLIYIGVTLMLAQMVGQIINQATDVEIDKINKPYRPIPRGIITKDEAMGWAWILMLFAVVRGFFSGIIFGSLIIVILFFAIFYNLPPIRTKASNEWIALLWMSFSRGYLPFITVWSVFGSLTDIVPHILGVITFFWCLAFQSSKDFGDVKGDKKFNIKTIPVVYGVDKAKKIMGIFGLLTIAVAGLLIGYLPYTLGLSVFITILVLVAIQLYLLFVSKNINTKNLENNKVWALYYLGIGFMYLVPFIVLIFI